MLFTAYFYYRKQPFYSLKRTHFSKSVPCNETTFGQDFSVHSAPTEISTSLYNKKQALKSQTCAVKGAKKLSCDPLVYPRRLQAQFSLTNVLNSHIVYDNNYKEEDDSIAWKAWNGFLRFPFSFSQRSHAVVLRTTEDTHELDPF